MISESDLDKLLSRYDYPSPSGRRDLWVMPLATLGLSNMDPQGIRVLYWQGAPRIVFGLACPPKDILAYAQGPAFACPPPVVTILDPTGDNQFYLFDANAYQRLGELPIWGHLLCLKPGRISIEQANAVVHEIAKGNRKWYEDDRSKRVVGALPRIFPEGTVILYELLQNAADSGATSAVFNIVEDTLLFLHDGYPFTENDVYAISFVNSSFKPADNIGFMGLGFKAAYEISDQPEIHSPPFHLCFDNTKLGGSLFPEPITTTCSIDPPYTTLFQFRLKPATRLQMEQELQRFDGRPLLYIGKKLTKLSTPKGTFEVVPCGNHEGARQVELRDSRTSEPSTFIIFWTEYEPSIEAVEEFARSRGLEPKQYQGRKQQISIAAELKGGIPDSLREGRLQAYLPTSVRLPLAFDIQGNFLLDASRQRLRNANGPWNLEYFNRVADLVASMLEWAKNKAKAGDGEWTMYYDLVPDWEQLCRNLNLDGNETTSANMMSRFKDLLSECELIPVSDSSGNLSFVGPDAAIYVDQDLQSVLAPKDIARLHELKPIWHDLSEQAKQALSAYLKRFGPNELLTHLSQQAWEQHVDALQPLPSSKEGRIQIAKILAYLDKYRLTHILALQKSRVILNQAGVLRAANQEGALKVRSLPEVEVGFPTEELISTYDIVHAGFRRELNRPSDMGLTPEITQAAVRTLEIVAPVLNPGIIAREIILPLFQGERWKDIPDDRLLRYTRFLMQHAKEIRQHVANIQILVKVKGTSKIYTSPQEVYFGEEYSIEGERLERLCGDMGEIRFLSAEYLPLGRTDRADWVEFFSALGVAAHPRLKCQTAYFQEWDINEVREATADNSLVRIELRASQIDDIPWSSYAVDDFILDPPIADRIRQLYGEKPLGWKDSLSDFARLIESHWENCSNKTRKCLRYARKYWQNATSRNMPAFTSFARLLKEEPWIPVLDIAKACKPSDLVLYNSENKELAGDQTLFSYCRFDNPEIVSFLEINQRPPESTALRRLRVAVTKQVSNLEQFATLYAELANNPGEVTALRQAFVAEPLIFVPTHESKYRTSNQVLYCEKTVLTPYFAAISAIYPALKQFFCDTMAIPSEEQLDHYICFLKEHVWKLQPPMTDNLRSSIESCYRRLFHCLNGAEEEDREQAQANLKNRLGPSPKVFCSALGWVSTSEKTVIYPDTRAYEEFVKNIETVAIESHMKRLALPLSEIDPLLAVFNIHPLSRAIQVVADIPDSETLENGAELAKRLSLLLRKAVALVESEQKESESVSRNIMLFLREWDELKTKLNNIHFWHSSDIQIKANLSHDPSQVFQSRLKAFLKARPDSLDIYLAGDIIEVFDTVADQLAQLMRLDLLPASLKEDVVKLLQNLARLDRPTFEALLSEQLQEKGFAVEEDPELRRIFEDATKGLLDSVDREQEASVHATDENKEPSSEPATPSGAGGAQHPDSKPSSETHVPTVEEILAQLPAFNDASYDAEKVMDLTATTSWEKGVLNIGHKGGGGGGRGGGNLAVVRAWQQAYGKRGESWVVEQERRALTVLGRPYLAEQVKHKSLEDEGSPWDVESFTKVPPFAPIYIEVKSTPRSDDFTIEMSAEQIRTALASSSRPYYIYRVVEINSNRPRLFIYDFKSIAHLLKVSSTNVEVALPRPQNSE